MDVCRLHVHEGYMHRGDGSWDFTLYDKAFRAAEKYNIKVFATLAPHTGGGKFAYDQTFRDNIAAYIEKVVSHFKNYPSLYAWVVFNEIGFDTYPARTPFIEKEYENWNQRQKSTLSDTFRDRHFLVDLNTTYLEWLVDEVTKHDPGRRLHVNTHAIFRNIAQYDFPAWRKSFTSLGMSAHPSWHYGYFDRNGYALALSANCDITKAGSGTLPFWVTELQGGNNIYSGTYPFCPTREEITQWLWINTGTGADGTIFWSLNPRSAGKEAGEWALLNFQNEPSERMEAAADVAACLNHNKELFKKRKVITSPVSILYIKESLWTEENLQQARDPKTEGRQTGGVIKSAIAFYQVLLENGIKSNFMEIGEFDWEKKDYTGETIILANQVALPSVYWDKLTLFVSGGGKLIVEGLTAFFNENIRSLHTTGFPLKDLFGGELSEVICQPGDFTLSLEEYELPAHLWKGYIFNRTGDVLGRENKYTTAIRHSYGKGSVTWIPSLIGLGAWRTGNKKELSRLFRNELGDLTGKLPILFDSHHDGIIMHTLQAAESYITVVINKSSQAENIKCITGKLDSRLLFSNKNGKITGRDILIHPEETIVIAWK